MDRRRASVYEDRMADIRFDEYEKEPVFKKGVKCCQFPLLFNSATLRLITQKNNNSLLLIA